MHKSRGKSNKKNLKKINIEYENKEDSSGSEMGVNEEYNKKEKSNTNRKLKMMQKYESTVKLPEDFQKTWDAVKKMRGKEQAPVDTMGCEYCPDTNANRPTFKFQTLVSLLLSSQTKDPITFSVMDKLIKHGLTIDNIIQTRQEDIRDIIYGVSFHNNKSKYMKQLASVLKENFNSNPPENIKEILSLPGIGPKMAYIYLQYCCDKIEGIAVDTHVHRICNRLKWSTETKTPEHTRKEVESWLPKELWGEINLLLVGFGQTICSAVAPKCQECLLNKQCEFGIERLKKLKNPIKSKNKMNSESLKRNSSPEKLPTNGKKKKK
jgi:endonuclease-3